MNDFYLSALVATAGAAALFLLDKRIGIGTATDSIWPMMAGGMCICFALSMFLAGWASDVATESWRVFEAECVPHRPRYECRALWRGGSGLL